MKCLKTYCVKRSTGLLRELKEICRRYEHCMDGCPYAEPPFSNRPKTCKITNNIKLLLPEKNLSDYEIRPPICFNLENMNDIFYVTQESAEDIAIIIMSKEKQELVAGNVLSKSG